MLTAEFEAKLTRLAKVRDATMRSLAAQHASSLQRQGVAMKGLARDLQTLYAELESIKEGLGEQLKLIDAGVRPHWKFVPLQRVATTTEREAALTLQRNWRRRRRVFGWNYSAPAERWAVMHDATDSLVAR